jgi:uncharacterized cupin superfamily protein
MQYFKQAQSSFKPPLVANENAFLGDVASTYVPFPLSSPLPFPTPSHPNLTSPPSDSPSTSTPISGGFYRLEAGTPLDYTYSYDEIKIILEGHFYIKDETGTEVKGEKGDVFLFPTGSRIIFRTDEYGLAFFVGQRKKDTL